MATVADDMTIDRAAVIAQGDTTRPVVAGHYEIDMDQPLGAGGMAVVYRGRDLRTRRDVALKTLRPEYRKDPETRARFRKEARTMAFLGHPNVTRVYDLFEDDEAPWAIMEFVPGRSLKEAIAQDGPFSIEMTAKLLDQAAKALDHLHGRGLVHLDVKPQNLILTPDNSVKLIDFGIAQRAGEPQEMIGGTAFGTAAYLSPEQACGEPVEAATDIYALGCVVFEMLTGRPPFGSDPANSTKDDLVRAHVEREPPLPSSVTALPSWVDDVILRALAKKPRDRYRTCAAFTRAFWDGIEHPPVGPTTEVRLAARPVVIDTGVRPSIDPEPARSRRTVGGVLYRTGGRMARHSGPLRRAMWRATIALFVGNLLLAGMLYLDRGEVPGLIADGGALVGAGEARANTDRVRVRSGPGRENDIVGLLALDQTVRLTGEKLAANGEEWWPVEATIDGFAVSGYVSAQLLDISAGPGHVWWRDAVDEVSSWPGRAVDAVLD